MIKISVLKSSLHDETVIFKENKEFLESIENEIHEELVISDINDYDCDLKLIFIASGGSEGLFLNNFDNVKAPYYFLTSGANNSLAASLEILTYLNNKGLTAEVIHGDISYIAKRLKMLTTINQAKRILENSKLGVIGRPSDWLISSVPAYEDIKNIFGITLKDVDMKEFISYVNEANENEYCEPEDLLFSKRDLDIAKKIYLAMERVKSKEHLDGLTIRCFDLLSSVHSTGCLGLALLNKKGYIGTCEGDIMAMISMIVIKALTSNSSFQANPSRIDPTLNRIIFAHCTMPFDMASSYKITTHFESGIGVAIKGELKEEDVTVFRLSSDLKRYFVSNGRILRNLNEKNLCRTQIEVELEENVEELLKRPCGNHHIIVYGHHKDEIVSLMNELYH